MKIGIHPEYHLVTVKCACGNSFVTRSTRREVHLDICSGCHPFFTGKQKFVDTEGRIDKFQKKFEKAKVHKETAKAKKKTAVKSKLKAPSRIDTSTGTKKAKVLTSRPKS